MAEHTELPKLMLGYVHVIEPGGKEYVPTDDAVIHLEGDEDSEIRVQCPNAPDVAAFIVKACNSHDALVNALKYARDELERVAIDEDPFTDVLAEIDAALLAAREVKP